MVWIIVVPVIIVRNLLVNCAIENNSSFVGPASSNIADIVTSTSQNQKRDVEALDKLDTTSVTLQSEVEAAQTIVRQGVSPTLQDDG